MMPWTANHQPLSPSILSIQQHYVGLLLQLHDDDGALVPLSSLEYVIKFHTNLIATTRFSHRSMPDSVVSA
jgi:hypothetical protein